MSDLSPLASRAEHLRGRVIEGRVTPMEAVSRALDRAYAPADRGEALNAVLWSDREASLAEASRAADAVARGAVPGALHGVPVMVKDNIATVVLPTTCGSRMLAGYVSPFEATAVRRLRNAGALVVGKTNCDEFAMGSTTEYSAWGPTRNPVDPTRVPGGSSGGSAAVVAEGIVPVALGSETGGSVRQPAAFCGIVGVKPTYGRVSRWGLVAFASSLDQIGVLSATVDDAALALEIIAGRDPLDSTSASVPVPPLRAQTTTSIKGMVIGRPREYFPESLDPRIAAHCDRALDILRGLGATVREVSLPHSRLAIEVYYIIAPAEASANLARFDGVRYGMRIEGDGLEAMYEATRGSGFGPEVTRRILLGTYVLSAGHYQAYYEKAQQVRSLIAHDFRSAFDAVDLLLTPTAPTTAFPLGAVSDPYEMYLSDIFTATANLAGVPAISLPIGRVDGLPIGGQLIAPHFAEDRMFAAAFALERALGEDAHR